MSEDYGPITGEMIKAMINGAVLEAESGETCHYDLQHHKGPFIYTTPIGYTEQMAGAWKSLRCRIRREPKTRPMTRMERLGILTREGCVVRLCGSKWIIPNTTWIVGITEDRSDDEYEYAIIDRDGNIIEGPSEFVKEVRE